MTNTPKPQADTLDEILYTLEKVVIDNSIKLLEDHTYKFETSHDKAHETAKQQLLAEVLDMIGKDMNVFGCKAELGDDDLDEYISNLLNGMREQYRKAAQERFK